MLLCTAMLLPACTPKTNTKTVLPADQVTPLKFASLDELLDRVREQAEAIQSVNAVTELDPSTGSSYSGVIRDYRDVRAFVLATRESGASRLRMIGQAPVVRKTVFDMVADLAGFRISIPPKHKFIVGSNRVEHRSEKPIENLRPQHLFEAFLPVAPSAGEEVILFVEENEFGGRRYYVLTEIARRDADTRWGPAHKWWFDRRDLSIVRVQVFDPEDRLVTDIHYGDWRTVGELRYPYKIELIRPHDDYQLKLSVKSVKLNEGLTEDQFALRKPPKAELINLDELAAKKKLEEQETAAGSPPAKPEGLR